MKKMRTVMIWFSAFIMLWLGGCSLCSSEEGKGMSEPAQIMSEEVSTEVAGEETPEETPPYITTEAEDNETENATPGETSEVYMSSPSWEESTERLTEAVVEIRLPWDSVKESVHTFLWGDGSGEVGYRYEEMTGFRRGPQAFVVEDGVIYVLDSVNCRVIILGNERVTEIDLDEKFYDVELIVQNQKIGVVDYQGDVVRIYREDGTQEHYIDLSYAGKVTELVEIGDNYVDWVITTGNCYRYHWETKRLEKRGAWENDIVEVSAPVERNTVVADGIDHTGVYYHYIDTESFRLVICRENDGYRWITEVDWTNNRSYPFNPIYYSREGVLYLMECFEDQIVISKLTLE